MTSREIKKVYPKRATRDAAKSLYEAMRDGDVVREEQIIREAKIGRRDAILVVEGVRPVYAESQARAAVRAFDAIQRGDDEAVGAEFASASIDIEDLYLLDRLGLLAFYRDVERHAVQQPTAQEHAARPSPDAVVAPSTSVPVATESTADGLRVTTEGRAEGTPSAPVVGLDIELPDGTDLTDPRVQEIAERQATERHGEEACAVLMWPRYPDVEDGVAPLVPIVLARPDAWPVPLSEASKPTDAFKVQAQMGAVGLDLVEWAPNSGFAVAARLSPDQREIRKRLATIIQRPASADLLRPWEVEVAVHRVADETGRMRLDQVVIMRMQESTAEATKRRAHLESLIGALPGGSSGWEVVDDLVSGVARLRYGQPRVLLDQVSYDQIGLEPIVRRDLWHQLPFGLTPEGTVTKIDLKSGPHIGVGGATGSGKSITIRALLTGALLHGMDVVVIDPKKSCGDFRAFEPYAVAWGDDTLEQAADIMETVYAEGARRKAILKQMRLPDIWELSQAERDHHGIKPILCVFDEYQAAMIAKTVPKGVGRDDPLVQRAQEHNYAVARIQDTAQSGVLELRYVGIHFLFAGQVVSADAFGSALRANLSSVVYGVPKVGGLTPKREIVGMQFGDSTAEALELIAELRTPHPGLALSAGEDGAVGGCRVAFGRPEEITALLEAAGVEKVNKWDVAAPQAEPREGDIIPPAAAPAEPVEVVTDLGTTEFTLDDLEDLVEFDDEPPTPTVTPVVPPSIWD